MDGIGEYDINSLDNTLINKSGGLKIIDGGLI